MSTSDNERQMEKMVNGQKRLMVMRYRRGSKGRMGTCFHMGLFAVLMVLLSLCTAGEVAATVEGAKSLWQESVKAVQALRHDGVLTKRGKEKVQERRRAGVMTPVVSNVLGSKLQARGDVPAIHGRALLGDSATQESKDYAYLELSYLIYKQIVDLEMKPQSTYSLPYGGKCSSWKVLQTFSQFETEGALFYNPSLSTIVVAFRGTSSLADGITDGRAWMSACAFRATSCGFVHNGFLRAYMYVRQRIADALIQYGLTNGNFTLGFTGHSLGGALATLSLWDLATDRDVAQYVREWRIVTFGRPRVGNTDFAKLVDGLRVPSSHYITVDSFGYRDPVTNVPPTWLGYAHTEGLAMLKTNLSSFFHIDLHHIDTYEDILGELVAEEIELECGNLCGDSGSVDVHYSALIPPGGCRAFASSTVEYRVSNRVGSVSRFAVCVFDLQGARDYRYTRDVACGVGKTPALSSTEISTDMKMLNYSAGGGYVIPTTNVYFVLVENHNFWFGQYLHVDYVVQFYDVLSPPSEPLELSTVSIGPFSAGVTWRMPLYLGRPAMVSGYGLQVIQNSELIVNATLPGDASSFSLGSLDPEVSYSFSLTAFNGKWGPQSALACFETLPRLEVTSSLAPVALGSRTVKVTGKGFSKEVKDMKVELFTDHHSSPCLSLEPLSHSEFVCSCSLRDFAVDSQLAVEVHAFGQTSPATVIARLVPTNSITESSIGIPLHSTLLEVQGNGFPATAEQAIVKIKVGNNGFSQPCVVESSSPSNIKCRIDWSVIELRSEEEFAVFAKVFAYGAWSENGYTQIGIVDTGRLPDCPDVVPDPSVDCHIIPDKSWSVVSLSDSFGDGAWIISSAGCVSFETFPSRAHFSSGPVSDDEFLFFDCPDCEPLLGAPVGRELAISLEGALLNDSSLVSGVNIVFNCSELPDSAPSEEFAVVVRWASAWRRLKSRTLTLDFESRTLSALDVEAHFQQNGHSGVLMIVRAVRVRRPLLSLRAMTVGVVSVTVNPSGGGRTVSPSESQVIFCGPSALATDTEEYSLLSVSPSDGHRVPLASASFSTRECQWCTVCPSDSAVLAFSTIFPFDLPAGTNMLSVSRKGAAVQLTGPAAPSLSVLEIKPRERSRDPAIFSGRGTASSDDMFCMALGFSAAEHLAIHELSFALASRGQTPCQSLSSGSGTAPFGTIGEDVLTCFQCDSKVLPFVDDLRLVAVDSVAGNEFRELDVSVSVRRNSSFHVSHQLVGERHGLFALRLFEGSRPSAVVLGFANTPESATLSQFVSCTDVFVFASSDYFSCRIALYRGFEMGSTVLVAPTALPHGNVLVVEAQGVAFDLFSQALSGGLLQMKGLSPLVSIAVWLPGSLVPVVEQHLYGNFPVVRSRDLIQFHLDSPLLQFSDGQFAVRQVASSSTRLALSVDAPWLVPFRPFSFVWRCTEGMVSACSHSIVQQLEAASNSAAVDVVLPCGQAGCEPISLTFVVDVCAQDMSICGRASLRTEIVPADHISSSGAVSVMPHTGSVMEGSRTLVVADFQLIGQLSSLLSSNPPVVSWLCRGFDTRGVELDCPAFELATVSETESSSGEALRMKSILLVEEDFLREGWYIFTASASHVAASASTILHIIPMPKSPMIVSAPSSLRPLLVHNLTIRILQSTQQMPDPPSDVFVFLRLQDDHNKIIPLHRLPRSALSIGDLQVDLFVPDFGKDTMADVVVFSRQVFDSSAELLSHPVVATVRISGRGSSEGFKSLVSRMHSFAAEGRCSDAFGIGAVIAASRKLWDFEPRTERTILDLFAKCLRPSLTATDFIEPVVSMVSAITDDAGSYDMPEVRVALQWLSRKTLSFRTGTAQSVVKIITNSVFLEHDMLPISHRLLSHAVASYDLSAPTFSGGTGLVLLRTTLWPSLVASSRSPNAVPSVVVELHDGLSVEIGSFKISGPIPYALRSVKLDRPWLEPLVPSSFLIVSPVGHLELDFMNFSRDCGSADATVSFVLDPLPVGSVASFSCASYTNGQFAQENALQVIVSNRTVVKCRLSAPGAYAVVQRRVSDPTAPDSNDGDDSRLSFWTIAAVSLAIFIASSIAFFLWQRFPPSRRPGDYAYQPLLPVRNQSSSRGHREQRASRQNSCDTPNGTAVYDDTDVYYPL